MCVIVAKIPKIDIEEEKLESAFLVNPDGWGISRPNYQGKIETLRGLKDTQKKFYEYYTKYKDKTPLYFHMRYATCGEKSVENTHPYKVLDFKEHGVDIEFMHNGTISRFSSYTQDKQKESDTYRFVYEVVKPVLESAVVKHGPKGLLKLPFLKTILAEFAGGSKFLLVDGWGEVLIINEVGGNKFDWGWSSNEYSFNRTHREVKHNQSNFTSGKSITEKGGISGNRKSNQIAPWEPQKSTAYTAKTSKEIDDLNKGEVIRYTKDLPEDDLLERATFVQTYGFENLMDVCCLTESDIKALCESDPENMTLLIQDLLLELYDARLATDDKEAEKKAEEASHALTQADPDFNPAIGG